MRYSPVLMAIFMANAGGAWDNAKNGSKQGRWGKGSEPPRLPWLEAVGSVQDTAGPSINILIKLMSIVALVFAPLFL